MNFPVGPVVMKGATPYDVTSTIGEFGAKAFNGYIIQTIDAGSIEEGILFIRDGKLLASVVESLTAKKTLKSMEAFKHFLNQTRGRGFYQVVELSRSQVDLVTAFDEKMLIGQEIALKDVTKLIPNIFTDKFATGETKQDIFEAHGLGGLK